MITCVIKKNDNSIIIPNEAIRIRIIANSNNIEDQYKKIKIKKDIESVLNDEIKKSNNINEARNIIKNKINTINTILDKNIKDKDYNINYGINYFPEKKYKGIVYKEGEYESLVIKLGKAEGDNWWCVLFPPLCMIDAEYENKDDIEYKSKVLEIINKFK